MFTITFFPATYGDSIWISYGAAQKPHHILIDGGTAGTRDPILKKLNEVEEKGGTLELVVVTHVDRDHIEGILSIFERIEGGIKPNDFWFNAWKHLVKAEEFEKFGAEQGEKLSTFLTKSKIPWNKWFDHKAVVVPDTGALPAVTLNGKAKLTLLSPCNRHLAALKPVWQKEIIDAGLVTGKVPVIMPKGKWERYGGGKMPNVEKLCKESFKEDDAKVNGSSIAFLFKYAGKSVLLTGDAHPSTIKESLDRIPRREGIIDLFKLSHHGSKGNTSPDLFASVVAKDYVISTNGSNYYHPDQETIARLLKSNKEAKRLVFNYRSEYNRIWDNPTLKKAYRYQTIYGADGEITISLGT